MLPKTVEEVKAHCGFDTFDLTDREHEWLYRMMAPEEIIVTDKTRKNEGYCLSCRTHILLDVSIHNNPAKCPHCLLTGKVLHRWRRNAVLYQQALVYLYRKSIVDQSCLVEVTALAKLAYIGMDCEDIDQIRVRITGIDSVSVFSPGEGGVQMIPDGCNKIGISRQQRYKISSRPPHCRDGAYGRYGATLPVYIAKRQLLKLAEGTPWSYGLKEYAQYAKDAFIGYLHVMHRWPAYEMLVKMNLGQIVADKLEAMTGTATRYYWRANDGINWRGKTLDKILGFHLTKEERKYLSGKLSRMEQQRLSEIISLRQRNLPSGPTIIDIMAFSSTIRLKDIETEYGISIKKLSQYARKLGELYPSDYYDYLRQLDQLGLPMTKQRLYPKDLQAEHARLSERIKTKRNAAQELNYKKQRRQKQKLYHYHDERYYIITPPKVSLLIREGEIQHNCVASYIDRVSTGKTNVVFLRKKRDWRTPFGTVEVREDGFIVQARAAYNRPLPDDARDFITKFSEEVKHRIAKQKAKQKGKKTA